MNKNAYRHCTMHHGVGYHFPFIHRTTMITTTNTHAVQHTKIAPRMHTQNQTKCKPIAMLACWFAVCLCVSRSHSCRKRNGEFTPFANLNLFISTNYIETGPGLTADIRLLPHMRGALHITCAHTHTIFM